MNEAEGNPESEHDIMAPEVASEAAEPEAAAPASSAEQDAALIADLKDRLLRALAEVENVRRRGEREREDARLYAATNFARDIVRVADNLRRGLERCLRARVRRTWRWPPCWKAWN